MQFIVGAERRVLTAILDDCENAHRPVNAERFRADNYADLSVIDESLRKRCIIQERENYRLSITTFRQLNSLSSSILLQQFEKIWLVLKDHYKTHLRTPLPINSLAEKCQLSLQDTHWALDYMYQYPWDAGRHGSSGPPYEAISVSEKVLRFQTFSQCIDDMMSWPVGPSHVQTGSLFVDINSSSDTTSVQPLPVIPLWIEKLPPELQALTQEIYKAKHHCLLALCAMGIRSAVDMASVDALGEDAGPFQVKLDKLKENGHITATQHNHLSAVVDAGHAAAHRGFIPDLKFVSMMLDAMSHLLHQIYVYENSTLELIANTPSRKRKVH